MAPRGKKAKAAEVKADNSGLLAALSFVAVAQKDAGQPHETHCQIANGAITAYNGILSAGCKISEDITANPHTHRFIDAMAKCGQHFSLTQLDSGRLAVRSEKFKAIVPCFPQYLAGPEPDAPCAAINDNLKEGFPIVGELVKDNSEFVIEASILLRKNSMVSTNRHVILEYWHGIDLPDLLIPKISALTIAKCGKKLTQLGFSPSSVTFWFEDGSWIKTQQYVEKWPNIDKVLNQPSDPKPVPETFFHALGSIAPFSENNTVYFGENELGSHNTVETGATYEVEGVPNGLAFNIKYLKLIEPYAKTIDFVGANGIAYFFGDKVRGAIAGCR